MSKNIKYKWKINGTIIRDCGKVILYGKRSLSIIKNKDNYTWVEQFLTRLDNGISDLELTKYANSPAITCLIEKMKSFGLLVKDDGRYEDTALQKSYDFLRFHKRKLYDDNLFEFNCVPRISILGCGGVGANIAINLLLSGFKKFILVDFDRVSNSNLNRQFPYTKDDVGQLKTSSLKQHMLSYGIDDVDIVCFNFMIDSLDNLDNKLPIPDFIVCGIDYPLYDSKLRVADYAIKHAVPVVFGGCGYEQIFVGPLLNSKEMLYKYKSYLKDISGSLQRQNKMISGSLPSVNSLLTSILTQEIINYFYQISSCTSMGKVFSVDVFNYKFLELVNFN